MAKSLRSHSKLKSRNLKRYTATSDYAVTAAARLNKVASRLQQRAQAPRESDANDDQMEEESLKGAEQVDQTSASPNGSSQAHPKISTSGPRGSRNEQWRRSHKVKGSKNGGRPKRRR
ncbi:hypothetical protein MYAM1_001057 [Malassezia yamatoensis]|uniref:DUF2423 domain-containing protein n=1 Tax=Malassezia yamatoensis TaxID=253288 RepID=A0AAJ5YT67_9BASI|nr:hypothetical protein MYAM1_001057 [Malassezia yamatoensis]